MNKGDDSKMTKKEKLMLSDSALNSVIGIEGTNYDRRRKLTNKQIASIKRSAEKGKDIKFLSEKYGVSQNTIRYHVDPKFKAYMNAKRAEYGSYTNASSSYKKELAEYKRFLIHNNKRLVVTAI